jgi:hypothetical protein
MQYVIGVDGGGSKLELCVADLDGRIVKTVRVERGCNPWNNGLEQTLQVLNEAFDQVASYKDDTQCIAAGMAGMLDNNKFTQPLREVLESFCSKVVLTGDLPTSFRAVSDAQSGLIAIAGTGSSLLLLKSDGSHMVWDGVAPSGRDLGISLVRAWQRGSLGDAGAAFMHQHAQSVFALETSEGTYHHAAIPKLGRLVAELDESSAEFNDLKIIIDALIDRWRFKLYGFSKLYRQFEPDDEELQIVLNGGLWRFDYFRRNIVKPLSAEFPRTRFLFDPERPPVKGAIKMALEHI